MFSFKDFYKHTMIKVQQIDNSLIAIPVITGDYKCIKYSRLHNRKLFIEITVGCTHSSAVEKKTIRNIPIPYHT